MCDADDPDDRQNNADDIFGVDAFPMQDQAYKWRKCKARIFQGGEITLRKGKEHASIWPFITHLQRNGGDKLAHALLF